MTEKKNPDTLEEFTHLNCAGCSFTLRFAHICESCKTDLERLKWE